MLMITNIENNIGGIYIRLLCLVHYSIQDFRFVEINFLVHREFDGHDFQA